MVSNEPLILILTNHKNANSCDSPDLSCVDGGRFLSNPVKPVVDPHPAGLLTVDSGAASPSCLSLVLHQRTGKEHNPLSDCLQDYCEQDLVKNLPLNIKEKLKHSPGSVFGNLHALEPPSSSPSW